MRLIELWVGADFIYKKQRYCFIETNFNEKEILAVKINYDEPKVTGNAILSFPIDTEVEYCYRINKEIEYEEKVVDLKLGNKEPIKDRIEELEKSGLSNDASVIIALGERTK